MKIAIIGSGISGLSMGKMLYEKHEVVIFEKENKAGGLIKCERVNDCLFHKVGGHVFNSKNQEVLNWFWAQFDRDNEFVKATRKAKILFKNEIIGYPIENYIYLLDKEIIKKIVYELIDLQKLPSKSPFEYENFESFLKGNFGTTLYEIYFQPYNKKIWQTDLSTVAMEWLEGKLPMPNFTEIMQSNILREEDATMAHSSFYYPKEGGSQFIVDRMKKGLQIETGINIQDIKQDNGKWIINEATFDKIIYCGDIRKLPPFTKKILNDGNVDVSYLENLRSNGTSNLFCETDDNDISWLYIPENFTKAHRIIYTGNFSETNNRGSKRRTCVVEFSGKVDREVMEQEIKKLPGNLTPLAFNYEPNSYVIQDQNSRKEIAAAKNALEPKGFYLLGRFAEWEYYNMDKAIEAAFKIAENLS